MNLQRSFYHCSSSVAPPRVFQVCRIKYSWVSALNAKPVAVIYATNYLKESKIFTSSSTVTGKTYSINSNLNCNSSSVIYLITCNLCTLQYVGCTNTPFKVGFHNHKLAMKTHKQTCEVAIHFNNSQGNTIYPT